MPKLLAERDAEVDAMTDEEFEACACRSGNPVTSCDLHVTRAGGRRVDLVVAAGMLLWPRGNPETALVPRPNRGHTAEIMPVTGDHQSPLISSITAFWTPHRSSAWRLATRCPIITSRAIRITTYCGSWCGSAIMRPDHLVRAGDAEVSEWHTGPPA